MCGTPQSRACQASCSVVHGSLDVDFECEEPKQWLRLQLDWFSLRVLARSTPIPQQDLSRRAPRPTDGRSAHANTRTSSQLHVVAATAAPSHPELGDTKIIFDGERVTGAHPAPSRPPAMSPIPPQVQHAGNTPARRAQRACRAHPHAWPPRCVAPAPSGCAVAGIETDAHAARLARAAGGVPARPCGTFVETPVDVFVLVNSARRRSHVAFLSL